jgi:hypothetical protein
MTAVVVLDVPIGIPEKLRVACALSHKIVYQTAPIIKLHFKIDIQLPDSDNPGILLL